MSRPGGSGTNTRIAQGDQALLAIARENINDTKQHFGKELAVDLAKKHTQTLQVQLDSTFIRPFSVFGYHVFQIVPNVQIRYENVGISSRVLALFLQILANFEKQ